MMNYRVIAILAEVINLKDAFQFAGTLNFVDKGYTIPEKDRQDSNS